MPLSLERAGAAVLAGAWFLPPARLWPKHSWSAPSQPAPAPAQQAQPAAPQPPLGPQRVELVAMQADWTKVCGHDPQANKDICYTTRDFGTAADKQPALALAVYDVKGEDQRIVRMLLPVACC